MGAINSPYFEFIPLEMDVSASIIYHALAPLELRNLMAKVVTITIYPFLLIAAFEALIINGTKILLNAIIVVLNGIHGCLFDNPARVQSSGPLPPSTDPLLLNDLFINPIDIIEIPPPSKVDRLKVEDIVKTLATKGNTDIVWNHKARLKGYETELKDLHPFQFLMAIFDSSSKVKKLMQELMDRIEVPFLPSIPGGFLGGFDLSMQNPVHRANINRYLPSFAQSVGTTEKKVRSFFDPKPDWRGLVNHLIDKHRKA